MFKALLLTFNILCAGDAVTTHVILTHGGREVLLPTQNPWAVDTIVAGQALGVSTVFVYGHKKHPKATPIILGALVAVRAFAVVHNGLVVHEMLQYTR